MFLTYVLMNNEKFIEAVSSWSFSLRADVCVNSDCVWICLAILHSAVHFDFLHHLGNFGSLTVVPFGDYYIKFFVVSQIFHSSYRLVSQFSTENGHVYRYANTSDTCTFHSV